MSIPEEDFNRTSTIEEDFNQIEVIEDDRFGEIIILQNKEIPEMYIMAKEKISSTVEEFERDLFQAKQRKKLNNPNLLQMPDFSTSVLEDEQGQEKFLVCGFYEFPQWNLEKEIEMRKKENKKFEEEELLRLVEDIMNCLGYLQRKKMLHGDIRPKYISFEDEDMPNKLVDRLGNPFPPNKVQINVLKNNLNIYMSPVLFKSLSKKKKKIRHNPYKSDVFSFGIVLLEAGILKNVNDIYDKEKNEINIEKFMGYVEEFLNNFENGKLIQESLLWMLDLKGKTRVDPKRFMKKFNKLKIEIYGDEENEELMEEGVNQEENRENEENAENSKNINMQENENKEVLDENEENPIFLGSQVFEKDENNDKINIVKNVIRTVESNSMLFKYDQKGEKIDEEQNIQKEIVEDEINSDNIVSAEHRFNPKELERNTFQESELENYNQPTQERLVASYKQESQLEREVNQPITIENQIMENQIMENQIIENQIIENETIQNQILQHQEIKENTYHAPTTQTMEIRNNYSKQEITRENNYRKQEIRKENNYPKQEIRIENNFEQPMTQIKRVSNYNQQPVRVEPRYYQDKPSNTNQTTYKQTTQSEVRQERNYPIQTRQGNQNIYQQSELTKNTYKIQNRPNQRISNTYVQSKTENPNIYQQSELKKNTYTIQNRPNQRISNTYSQTNNNLIDNSQVNPRTQFSNNYYKHVNSEKIITKNIANRVVSNIKNERISNSPGINKIRYSLSHKTNLSNNKVSKPLETNLYGKDLNKVNSPNFYDNKYNVKTVVSSNKNEISKKSRNSLNKMSPQVLFKNFEKEQELKNKEMNIYGNENTEGLHKRKTINEFLTEHVTSQINLDNFDTKDDEKKKDYNLIPEEEKIKVKENLKDIQQLYKNSKQNINSIQNTRNEQNRKFSNIINKNFVSNKNISINREIYVPSNRTEEERRSYSNNIKKERLSTYDYDIKKDKKRNIRKYVLSRKTQSFLNTIDNKKEGFNNIYSNNGDDYVRQVRDDNSELMERYNNCLEVRQDNKNFKVFRVVL